MHLCPPCFPGMKPPPSTVRREGRTPAPGGRGQRLSVAPGGPGGRGVAGRPPTAFRPATVGRGRRRTEQNDSGSAEKVPRKIHSSGIFTRKLKHTEGLRNFFFNYQKS